MEREEPPAQQSGTPKVVTSSPYRIIAVGQRSRSTSGGRLSPGPMNYGRVPLDEVQPAGYYPTLRPVWDDMDFGALYYTHTSESCSSTCSHRAILHRLPSHPAGVWSNVVDPAVITADRVDAVGSNVELHQIQSTDGSSPPQRESDLAATLLRL